MNWQTICDPTFSGRLCMTLVHSLWQVTLFAAIAWAFDRLGRRRSVRASYAVHVAALLAGLAAMLVTYALVDVAAPGAVAQSEPTADVVASETPLVLVTSEVPRSLADLPERGPTAGSQPPGQDAVASSPAAIAVDAPSARWPLAARWIAAAYALGVVLMLVRLLRGMWHAHRLAARAEPIADGPLVERLRTLAHGWSMRVVPVLARAEEIVVPKVVGLLRPAILLPVSAITGLSPEELEMILAHELAHVRRHDMWVNLAQRLAEVVLFFNPALWYLSRRTSTLREYCCDELTCRATSGSDAQLRARYASALLRIVELSKPAAARRRRARPVETSDLAALAAAGRSPSDLRRRVARLFGEPLPEPVRLSRGGLLTLVVLAAVLFTVPTAWRSAASSVAAPATDAVQTQSGTDDAPTTEPDGEAAPRGTTISGRIVLEDGSPAKVKGWLYAETAEGSGIAKSCTFRTVGQYTDRFSFTAPAGTVLLKYFPDGATPASAGPFETEPGKAIDATIVLKSGFSSTVRVVDGDGKPIARASLSAFPVIHGSSNGPNVAKPTDDQGELRLEHLAETPYQFLVEAPGYETLHTERPTLRAGHPIVLTISRSEAKEAADLWRSEFDTWDRPLPPRRNGENADGVQLRLRCDKASWPATEIPALRAELRNGGERSNLAVVWGLGQLQLEVDGKWYKTSFFLGSAFKTLESGTVLDALVPLSPAWQEAKEEDLRWMGDSYKSGYWASSPFIRLRPGSHVVRVGCIIEPARRDAMPGFRVVSNPVTLVIEPPTDSHAVNWPASPELAKTVVGDLVHNVLTLLNITDNTKRAATIDDMLARARDVKRQSAGTPLEAPSQTLIRALIALRAATGDDGKPARELEETRTAVLAMLRVLAGVPLESAPTPPGDSPTAPSTGSGNTSKPAAKPVDLAVVVARHVMLLDGKEIITWAELEKRIAAMPDPSLALPTFYTTRGAHEAGLYPATKVNIWRLHQRFKLKGHSEASLSPSADLRYDGIKTAADLVPDESLRVEGRVVDGNGEPVADAEVLLLTTVNEPTPQKWHDVVLVEGRVRNPLEHVMTRSDAKGQFALYPPKDVNCFVVGLHPAVGLNLMQKKSFCDSGKVQLLPWATLTSWLADEARQEARLRMRVRPQEALPDVVFNRFWGDQGRVAPTGLFRFARVPPIFNPSISLPGKSRGLDPGPLSDKQREQLEWMRKESAQQREAAPAEPKPAPSPATDGGKKAEPPVNDPDGKPAAKDAALDAEKRESAQLAIDVSILGVDGKPIDQHSDVTIWERVKVAADVGARDDGWTDPRDGTIWRRVCGSISGETGPTRNGKDRFLTRNPLPPGVYRVTAFVGSRNEKMTGMAVSEPIRLDGSRKTTPVTISVENGPPATFTILDAKTEKPIDYPRPGIRLTRSDGLVVEWDPLNPNLFPGNDGKYGIEHLSPGSYRVDVSARTYAYGYSDFAQEKPMAIDIREGEANEVVARLHAQPLDEAEAKKRWPWAVEGTVADDEGRPLEGVEIRAATGYGTLRSTLPVVTDARGRYLLRFGPGVMAKNEKTGNWGADVQCATIFADKTGYAEKNLGRQGGLLMADEMPDEKSDWDRKKIILPDKPYHLDFTMLPAATIQGRLVDEKGEPLAKTGVLFNGTALPPSSSIGGSATTDAEGRFRFDRVTPGFAWWLELGDVKDLASSRTQPITLERGETYDVDLRIVSQEGAGKIPRIVGVKDSRGRDVLDKVIGDE